jgi:branched-chain amino acid transport system ATP-binding protein
MAWPGAAAMAEPLLRAEGLRKRYGGLAVTDGVSLELRTGEIHAVIGPNGAGKTTLIHELSGTVAPDAGRILFDGRDITRLSFAGRVRAGLARSFQVTSLLPGFSALEAASLAAQRRHGSSFRFFRAARREAGLNAAGMAALDAVGLAGRADVPAGALSHGEQRQLELALALATGPRALLLDEPLAGAGPEETARLVAILGRLRDRYAILLVEHDMDAVFALADRVTVLDQGRVLASGTPAAIRADAAVRSAYLGEEAMPC